MKRLDKAIHVLKAITKKLLRKIMAIERGKLTQRTSLVRKKHLVGQKLDDKVYRQGERKLMDSSQLINVIQWVIHIHLYQHR
ncbi:hypothetical protein HNY73_001673 [Argiope bruennichi]|uniref:Uncharacterized protein n=1 Tax=Argiope bruennichi TaxID=94029 RepID=A0A8T0FVE0_ARGBR|nr:hypothetical protein HNY73_001673 [Argiope bruennichi]